MPPSIVKRCPFGHRGPGRASASAGAARGAARLTLALGGQNAAGGRSGPSGWNDSSWPGRRSP